MYFSVGVDGPVHPFRTHNNFMEIKNTVKKMEKILYNGKQIEYYLEKKKIKNCYISVKNDKVNVRVPRKMTQEDVEKLILKRANWILKALENQKKKTDYPKLYKNGEEFSVLGKKVILKIQIDANTKPNLQYSGQGIVVTLQEQSEYDNQKIIQKLVEKFYDKLAEIEISKSMENMIKRVGDSPKSYKIKKLKSTWGNCSSTRNISLNRNLVMYSRNAIDYVCLHEICHLKHMNHSKNFWNMVEKYMPDYKNAEKELKN